MSNTLARPILFKPSLPQIDWGKGINNALVCDVPFYECNGGNSLDIVKKKNFAPTATPLAAVGWWGRGITYDGTTQYHVTTAPVSTLVDNFTMMVAGRFIAQTVADGAEQILFYNGRDNGGYGIGINGRNCEYLYGGVTRVTSGAPGDLDSAGKDHFVIVLRRRAGTSNMWRDGKDLNATSASAPGTPNTLTSIGAQDNGSGTKQRFANVTLQVARIWERPLTDQEIRQVSINPSVIYQYPQYPIFANAVAAGGAVYNSMRMMLGMGM